MKQKRIRKLMTISIDEDTMRQFKTLCVQENLKISRVLEESMNVFIKIAKERQMEEGNNDEIN